MFCSTNLPLNLADLHKRGGRLFEIPSFMEFVLFSSNNECSLLRSFTEFGIGIGISTGIESCLVTALFGDLYCWVSDHGSFLVSLSIVLLYHSLKIVVGFGSSFFKINTKSSVHDGK